MKTPTHREEWKYPNDKKRKYPNDKKRKPEQREEKTPNFPHVTHFFIPKAPFPPMDSPNDKQALPPEEALPHSKKTSGNPGSEARREMHRRCESVIAMETIEIQRRRERINQYYDSLFCLLKDTALVRAKKGAKIDRCSLIRYTNGNLSVCS